MTSLWTIPRPVKYLFETFPLKQYSSEPVYATPANPNQYALVRKSGIEDEKKTTFQLGVYNVARFLRDDNVLLPTDPICLSCQLIINLRNGLSFPQLQIAQGYKETRNYISVVSYHASYDNELPVFIEQESASKRTVNSTALINDLQMTRTKSKEMMTCLAVDSVLYDFWVITVLFEMDLSVQAQIYLSNTDFLLHKLILKSTLSSLLSRFGFNNRNKLITNFFNSDIFSQNSIADELNLITANAREILQLLNKSLEGKQFLNNNKQHPGVLDCKIAGIIYTVLKFAPQSKFGKLLEDQFPNLIKHAFEVIEKSI